MPRATLVSLTALLLIAAVLLALLLMLTPLAARAYLPAAPDYDRAVALVGGPPAKGRGLVAASDTPIVGGPPALRIRL